MASLTIAALVEPGSQLPEQLGELASELGAGPVLLACSASAPEAFQTIPNRYSYLQADLATSRGIAKLVEVARTDFLVLLLPSEMVSLCSHGPGGAIERM